MNNNQLLDYCLNKMAEAGADKAQVTLKVSEKHELNTESNVVKLLRSTDEFNLTLNYIKDQKAASTSVNKGTTEAIDESILKLVELSNAAPVDKASDIADLVDEQVFKLGVLKPDLDELYEALEVLNKEMKSTFTKISGDAILSYDKVHKYIANSNGLKLEEISGKYNFDMFFSAKDGNKITSFNYTSASTCDLKEKLTELGMLGELMEQSIQELDAKPFKGKFIGDVIIAPNCLEDFLSYIDDSALSDGALIGGSSKLKDKIGKKIASSKFTWHSNPRSNDLPTGYTLTGDGFVADDLTIVENGVLKSFLLSQYGAKKVGLERSSNYGGAFIVEPGNDTLEDMIKDVKRGILLTRFSGGRPGPDGGFSGVAKNSFYIEDGEVKYPMTETMISGNLFEFLRDIKSISQKRINYGHSILPWIATKGGTISGQ